MPEFLNWIYDSNGIWMANSSMTLWHPERHYHYSIRISEDGWFEVLPNSSLIPITMAGRFADLYRAKDHCQSRECQIREEAKPSPITAISIECSDAGEWTVKSPSITGMIADQLDAGEAMILLAALIITPQRREGIINGLSVPK